MHKYDHIIHINQVGGKDCLAQSRKACKESPRDQIFYIDNALSNLEKTPLGNLSEFMRHFNITYMGYFNRRHGRVGHLYQGRYKSILVDKDAFLSTVVDPE